MKEFGRGSLKVLVYGLALYGLLVVYSHLIVLGMR